MRRSMRPFWRTLRFRLTMWNIVLVLVTSIATVFGLREGVRFALLSEMDAVLAADLDEIVLASQSTPEAELHESLTRKARGHQQQGWFVELWDGPQHLNWSTGLPDSNAQQAKSATLRKKNMRTKQEYVPSIHGVTTIRVGASLELIDADMRRIDRLAVIVGVIALVAAPLGGYILAVRAIRPLTHVTKIASTLAPHQLDQRLPNRNTGDEMDLLSQTVNRLLDRIAAHLQQRHDLLANSAHELRSPLAAIRSSVEVGLNNRRSVAEYQELLLDLMGQCESLETLVNQLLLLAETEAAGTRERSERLSWTEIVQGSLEIFSAAAEVAELEMSADIQAEVYVNGNRQHLWQVINNLLDNAIKYTPAGGSIAVDLAAVDGQHAELRVADTGVGIAEADLPRVFERFYRGDKARRREQGARGTGLGLSICQSVIDAHGGKISISSQANQGTTVIVVLPLARAMTSDLIAAAKR